MKKEYDFSNAERGKFHRKNAEIRLPIYLEPEVAKVFLDSATVNEALRRYLSEHGNPPIPSQKAG